jgi:hypothetical protein
MKKNLALVNGIIHTLDGRLAEAVFVSGEKIAAIGSTSEITGRPSGRSACRMKWAFEEAQGIARCAERQHRGPVCTLEWTGDYSLPAK